MVMAATRPVIAFARGVIRNTAELFPFNKEVAFYFAALVIGPLLGSFITEPAAMTVTALILAAHSLRLPRLLSSWWPVFGAGTSDIWLCILGGRRPWLLLSMPLW